MFKKIIFFTFSLCIFSGNLSAKTKLRFSKNISLEGAIYQVRIVEKNDKWQVSLQKPSSKKTILKTDIPDWVAANYYAYSLSHQKIDGVHVVLFEANPKSGVNAPKDAEIVQIAWSNSKKRGWKTLTTTQTSILDGRDQLLFQKKKGKMTLIRIRSKNTHAFCGATLGVYRVYNADSNAFQSHLNVKSLSAKAEEINAFLPKEKFVPSLFVALLRWSFASSDRNEPDDSRSILRPLNLGDHSLKSFWSEGTKKGRGEFVTARVNDALKLSGLRIFPGVGLDKESFQNHHVPHFLLLSLSDGKKYKVRIPQYNFEDLKSKGGVLVHFPTPRQTSCLSVVLLDENDHEVDSSISEISPISELDKLQKDEAADAVIALMLQTKDTRRNRRLAQLTRPLDKQLKISLEKLLQSSSKTDRLRIIPLLRNLSPENTIGILVRLFKEVDPKDPAYAPLKASISTNPEAGKALVELYKKHPPKNEKKHQDLLRMMGRLSGYEGTRSFVDTLGQGSRRLRKERIRAISRSPKVLSELFESARNHIDSDKGEDALFAINIIASRYYSKQRAELTSANRLIEVVEKTKKRRLRILAAKASTFFQFSGDFSLYQNLLKSKDPMVRKFGVWGVAKSQTLEARQTLEKTLLDSSPDVRIRGIRSFEFRTDLGESKNSILDYASHEKWPKGLHFAYLYLARIGDQETLDYLKSIVVKNPNKKIALLALRAMIKEHHSIPATELEPLLKSASYRFMITSIDMLATLSNPQAAKILYKVIDGELPETNLDSKSRSRVYKRAILALGRQRTKSASTFLLNMLKLEKDFKIQRVILRALAFQDKVWVIRKLKESHDLISDNTTDLYKETIESIQRRVDIKTLGESFEE